jgi:hypothetical protein
MASTLALSARATNFTPWRHRLRASSAALAFDTRSVTCSFQPFFFVYALAESMKLS